MEDKVLFKAVTYESLKDARFIELARKAFPSLDQLLHEYSAAEGQPE